MDYKDPYWQFKELEKVLSNLKPILSTSDEIAKMLASPLKDLEFLSNRYLFPPAYLEQYDSVASIAKQLVTDSSFPAMYELDPTSASAVFSLQKELTHVLEDRKIDINFDMFKAHSEIAQSLIPSESMLQAGLIHADYAKLMFSPQQTFTTFADSYLREIPGSSDIFAKNSISAIAAGTAFLKPMSDGLEFAALLSHDSEIGVLDLDVNAYEYYDKYIRRNLDLEVEHDFEVIVEELPIETISKLGAEIIELVYNINTEAESLGREPVFKPTTKGLRACCIIPTKMAISGETFFEIVDQLFFLLYEGSGTAKRLLMKADEKVSDEVMEPLWAMKQFRLAARHDVDHGKSSEIKKKNMQIGNSFKSLIGKVMPKDETDWLSAQHEMYKGLIGVLDHYWFL